MFNGQPVATQYGQHQFPVYMVQHVPSQLFEGTAAQVNLIPLQQNTTEVGTILPQAVEISPYKVTPKTKLNSAEENSAESGDSS